MEKKEFSSIFGHIYSFKICAAISKQAEKRVQEVRDTTISISATIFRHPLFANRVWDVRSGEVTYSAVLEIFRQSTRRNVNPFL